MKRTLAFWLLATFTAACNAGTGPPATPIDEIPHNCGRQGLEVLADVARPPDICDNPSLCASACATPPCPVTNAPLPVCFTDAAVGARNCTCENYDGDYPDGVLNGTATRVAEAQFFLDRFGITLPWAGCNDNTDFAWPACSFLAEVSGRLPFDPSTSREGALGGGDDDEWMDVCPDHTGTPGSFAAQASEIRNSSNFLDRPARGSVHVEIQECRYYGGEYFIADTDASGNPVVRRQASRPSAGDRISAAGDWVDDFGHEGWAEIHEARIMAVVRPDDPNLPLSDKYFAMVNGIFAPGQQESALLLDVHIPPPPPTRPDLSKLECQFLPPTQALQVPACFQFFGITPSVHLIDRNTGTCQIQIDRAPDSTYELPDSNDCADTCNAFPNECIKIAYAGVMRAAWTDPGDFWICRNCACVDPSAVGARIAAPVQGCVTENVGALLHNPDTRAAAEAMACAQVCPNARFCGAAPACRIDACEPPLGVAAAELVGPGACDPTPPQPIVRPAEAADYRVRLEDDVTLADHSHVTISLGGHSRTRPIHGTIFLNARVAGGMIDFARVAIQADDFEVRGHDVTDPRLFTAERLMAQLIDGRYFVPTGEGVIAVRGFVDGDLRGLNTRNSEPFFGTLDLDARTFTLDFAGSDEENSIRGRLVGTIDNVPSVADARRTPAVVECSSPTLTPVSLDATASFDPDPGDAISHFQWFTLEETGVGNQAVTVAAIPLGLARFVLHVYDSKLGSDQREHDVTVVDTTPPSLELERESICLWPPNHPLVRIDLGADIGFAVADVCDATPDVRIISVASDQPDDGLGDGRTSPDVAFGPGSFCVRRERSGKEGSRTYRVTIEARDDSGNRTTKQIDVVVPHDHLPGCRPAGTTLADGAPCP